MKQFCNENVQELKTVLVQLAATMRTMDNYNALLYDDIHFNDHLGLPLLKNTLLSFLLLTSDGNLKTNGQQSLWRRNQYYNVRREDIQIEANKILTSSHLDLLTTSRAIIT